MASPNNDLFYPGYYNTRNQYNSYNREESTMSIAVALVGRDGIVLATDSRVVSLAPGEQLITYDDNCTKLWNIKDFGIAVVGNSVGYEGIIIDSFKNNTKNVDITTYDQLVKEFMKFLRVELKETIKQTKEFLRSVPLELGKLILQNYYDFVLVGYMGGIPQIKHISFDKGLITLKYPECTLRNYYMMGAWSIADYWTKKVSKYLPKMDQSELKMFAAFLVCQSTYFSAIGGHIQMITIQKDRGLQITPKLEVIALEKQAIKLTNSNTKSLISSLKTKE